MNNEQWRDVNNLVLLYEADLSAPLLLVDCWKWKRLFFDKDQLPDSPLAAINHCNSRLFKLLQLLCTLPVTSCEAERTFSVLRRIKPFLRATMCEDRIHGLAILLIHRNIPTDFANAVDIVCKKNAVNVILLSCNL